MPRLADRPNRVPQPSRGQQASRKGIAKKYGEQLIEKEKIALAKWGGDRNTIQITPEEALLEEVRRSVALVRWLEAAINRWQDGDDSLGGLPKLMEETYKGTPTFTDQREWMLIYQKEREHAAKVAKMAIDAGIANRMVGIAEDQGRLLSEVVRKILDAINLTPEQHAMVPRIVPQILRAASVQNGVPSITGMTA